MFEIGIFMMHWHLFGDFDIFEYLEYAYMDFGDCLYVIGYVWGTWVVEMRLWKGLSKECQFGVL